MKRFANLFSRRNATSGNGAATDNCGTAGGVYRGNFETALERSRRLDLFKDDVTFTDRRHLDDLSFRRFVEFAKREYPLPFTFGYCLTAPIVHTGLVPAVEKFFACRAYPTIGSVVTPRRELYPLT